jgi:hypothetical protein
VAVIPAKPRKWKKVRVIRRKVKRKGAAKKAQNDETSTQTDEVVKWRHPPSHRRKIPSEASSVFPEEDLMVGYVPPKRPWIEEEEARAQSATRSPVRKDLPMMKNIWDVPYVDKEERWTVETRGGRARILYKVAEEED